MSREERAAKIAAAAPRRPGRARWIVVAVVVLVVVAVGVVAVFRGRQTADPAPTSASAPRGSVGDGQGLNPYPDVKPQAGAPKVDLYTDFQCPICAEFEKNNGEALHAQARAGKVVLVEHTMTFLDRRLQNHDSSAAAGAAACSADQGVRGAFGQYVFAHQPEREGAGFPEGFFTQAARSVGLSGSRFDAFGDCVAKGTYAGDVSRTDERSGQDGIKGTPTFVIGGTTVTDEGTTASDWQALVGTPGSLDAILAKYAKK